MTRKNEINRIFLGLGPILALGLAACTATPGEEASASGTEAAATAGVSNGTAEGAAILKVANELSAEQLVGAVGLTWGAAGNIVTTRLGDDGAVGTTDDVRLASIEALDRIPLVGPEEFTRLRSYVGTRPQHVIHGYVPDFTGGGHGPAPELRVYAIRTDGSAYYAFAGTDATYAIAVEPGSYYVVGYGTNYLGQPQSFAYTNESDHQLLTATVGGEAPRTVRVEVIDFLARKVPVEPAPGAFGCEGKDYAGRCADNGDLFWCESNILRTKRCAAAGQTCGWQSDSVGFNCL